MKILPDGAQRIWDSRLAGFKPSEMVLVSLVGDLVDGNWQIFLSSSVHPRDYEWRWVRDLQVCLVYDSTCSQDRIKETALEIAKNKSIGEDSISNGFHGSLFLWNVSVEKGAHMKHTPEIHGDPFLSLPSHQEEIKFRGLYPYEIPFFQGIKNVI